jgi:flavin reductase (DIM6/NTAB) family NADH-FMN oxidoreductase RutF
MHRISNPSILYFGTPVVLVSTVNEDGTFNLAPISSVFWLGYRCVIGIAVSSKTTSNLLRTKECVLNLASVDNVDAVNRLALTTGSNPVPPAKAARGYRYQPDKFGVSGLTPISSVAVGAPRVLECPVHLECELITVNPLAVETGIHNVRTYALELKVVQVHLDENILMDDNANRIDPDKWRPLMMSFQEFYGLGVKVSGSRLATVPESLYRTPDVEAAGQANDALIYSRRSGSVS